MPEEAHLAELPAAEAALDGRSAPREWWRDAVIYEVYPRSFADSDGDGEGDLGGIRNHLPYLADLGVDAIWVAPWFPSPLADGGYDVRDYRNIDPLYGSLEDADELIEQAHGLGIRVIIDMVANHTSHEHPWFTAALASEPGSPERDRYFFRDGRGAGGELPPNNWISAFGGSAWSRLPGEDGNPGQWYLHLFAPEQPDLNWGNEQVRDEFDDILRFWFDRGVDGIRVDAAPALAKDPTLRDADYGEKNLFVTAEWVDNPHWDVDEVHEILRRWRRVGDSYGGDRVFVTEAIVNGAERLSRYLRPDEMHTAFNFGFFKSPWGPALRAVIDETLEALAPVGAPPTWVLESHDENRIVTRYGRARTSSLHIADDQGAPSDLALGRRRAAAAMLLMFALPGGVYIYQGQELGLPEVEDIPDDLRRDPIWLRSARTIIGRDGCRVPLPWSGSEPPYGFTESGRSTWLPQPSDWAALTVEAQSSDDRSMLTLVKSALRIRRETAGLKSDDFLWRDSPPDVLDFERGDVIRCVVNLSGEPVNLDGDWDVLLSSVPLEDGRLPHDAAAWLKARQA